MNSQVVIKKCVLCSSQQFETKYDLEYPISLCRECGLVFVFRRPSVRADAFYHEGYYRGKSSLKTNLENENVLDDKRIDLRLDNCKGIVNNISAHRPPPGKWLDVGCGPGFLLHKAQEVGWRCVGIDPSPFASQFAREQFGLEDIHTGEVEDFDFPKSSFDVATMQHVIEHFSDPLATMRKIVGWLKEGGVIYIETPDIDSPKAKRQGAKWEHIKLPEHLFYFSKDTLTLLLKKVDCDIIQAERPVETTGMLNRLCGGPQKARQFYDRFHRHLLFRKTVAAVRRLNAWRRFRSGQTSDSIHVIAKKRSFQGSDATPR